MSNLGTVVKNGLKKVSYNLNNIKGINFKIKAVGLNGLNIDKTWKLPTIYFGIYGTDSDVTPYTSALSGGQSTSGADGTLLLDFTTAANLSTYLLKNSANLKDATLTSTRYLWFYVTQGKDTVIATQNDVDISATLLTMRYSAVCLGSIKSILDMTGITSWGSRVGPIATFYYADQRDPFPTDSTELAVQAIQEKNAQTSEIITHYPSVDYPNLVVTIAVQVNKNLIFIPQSRTMKDDEGNKTTVSTTNYYFIANYEGDLTTNTLSGEGAPSSSLGTDDDIYFDTTNMTYYRKSDSSWDLIKLEDLLGLIADTKTLSPKYLLGYSSNTGGNVLMWGKDFGTLISTKIDIAHAVAYLNAGANSRLQGNFETFRFPAKWTWQQIIDSGIVSECAVYQESTGELTTTGLLFGDCQGSVGLGAYDYLSNFRFPDWIKCTVTNKSVPSGATYSLTKYTYTQTRTHTYGTYADGTDFDRVVLSPTNLDEAKKLASTTKTVLESVDLSADTTNLDFIDLDVIFGDPRIKVPEQLNATYTDWVQSSSEDLEDTTPDGIVYYTVDTYTRQVVEYVQVWPDCYTSATTQAEWPVNVAYESVIRLKGVNTADNPVVVAVATLGANKVAVDSDCNYYYFTPEATGLYHIVADSANAYIGYVTTTEDDDGYEMFNEATWADDGLTFDLWCYKGKTIYIACSTADFSYETYTLNISTIDN